MLQAIDTNDDLRVGAMLWILDPRTQLLKSPLAVDIVSSHTDSREIETTVNNHRDSREIVTNVFIPAVHSFANVAYRVRAFVPSATPNPTGDEKVALYEFMQEYPD
jgi:hypothetical protein